MQLDSLVPQWLQWPLPLPKLPQRGYELGELLGVRYKLGVVAGALLAAVATGLALVLVITLLRVVLRNRWLSSLAGWVSFTLYFSAVAMGDTFQPWLTYGRWRIGVLPGADAGGTGRRRGRTIRQVDTPHRSPDG